MFGRETQVLKVNANLFLDAEDKGFYVSVSTSILQAYERQENSGWVEFNLQILVAKRQSDPAPVPTPGSLALLGSPVSGAG